jgi:hypothetical protein
MNTSIQNNISLDTDILNIDDKNESVIIKQNIEKSKKNGDFMMWLV